MRVKPIVLLSSIALSALPTPYLNAAPKLQMHVYEEVPVQLPPKNQVVGKAEEPERLRVHIYEKKPKVINSEGHRALASVHNDEPLVSYNGVDFYLGAGLRRDKLFEQKFYSNQLGADLTVHLPNMWFISSSAAYGNVESGRIIDGGDLFDASISFGKVLDNESPFSGFDRIEWRPQLGYSYHEQDINVNIVGLNTNTKWYGPWLGGSATLIQDDRFAIGLSLEYHYAYVDVDAELQNLRFSGDARANGFSSNIFSNWNIGTNFALNLDISSQYLKTNSSGEEELKWKNIAAEVGLEYQF